MSNNAASCDNNPLEINNVNTLECVPQKHPGAYELQVEPTDNESTDDASNSTVTEYTLKAETLLSNNDACLESVSSNDNSINAVIIDDDEITKMEAEPLPLIVIELMDDVWCKSNAEKKKLVTVRLHESRISYVTKVLFVSSKRKQVYCVKNLSCYPHYQISNIHVSYMFQQMCAHNIPYLWLKSHESHILEDIIVINEGTPEMQQFHHFFLGINVGVISKRIKKDPATKTDRGNAALSAGIAAMRHDHKSSTDLNIPSVRVTTDIMMKKLMVLLTKVADQMEQYAGPIWGPHDEYNIRHNMFARNMMKQNPTCKSIFDEDNRCEGITGALSGLLKLLLPHLDKHDDDLTISFNHLIAMTMWYENDMKQMERLAILGYSRLACRNHMRREQGIVQLPIDIKEFIQQLPLWRTKMTHEVLHENYGDIEYSKFDRFAFGISYFARLPHMNKTVYYSSFVHQIRRVLYHFKPCAIQIAQIITTIVFGNGPIVFYAVLSKWLRDGSLPKEHLCYAYVHDAFFLGFDHMNCPEFMRHKVTFSPRQKCGNIEAICDAIIDVMHMALRPTTTYKMLLTRMKKPRGIADVIGTHVLAILALSGLLPDPRIADATDGTGRKTAMRLKEHYALSTNPQINAATAAVAEHCEMDSLSEAEQSICEFGRHFLAVKKPSDRSTCKVMDTHNFRDVIFHNQRLYMRNNDHVISISSNGEKRREFNFSGTIFNVKAKVDFKYERKGCYEEVLYLSKQITTRCEKKNASRKSQSKKRIAKASTRTTHSTTILDENIDGDNRTQTTRNDSRYNLRNAKRTK